MVLPAGSRLRRTLAHCYQRVAHKRFFRARAGSPELVWPNGCKALVLPRTRGFTHADGRHQPRSAVLPRTRGFTIEGERKHLSTGGSSAHARVHRTGWRSRCRF